MTAQGRGSFVGSKVTVSQVHGDLSQEVVQITVDRLSLILYRHADALAHRKGILAPLGILLSLIATLVTATFNDWLVPAATWKAIFILVGLATLLWLIAAIVRAVRAPTVKDLVKRIKDQSADG